MLIDGRSVYTPLFAGVWWNVQDTLLEDIDRIEVIRGPGGTIWGPNAVYGVINIITKSAKDTHGTVMSTAGGNVDQGFGFRYGAGRGKKFNQEDDTHFLEVKSVIVQELELILSAVDVSSPTKEEIHTLVGSAPSLRYLSEMNEGALRNLENQWHRVYIGWHAILGQLKVKQRQDEAVSGIASIFGRKKAA